MLAVDEVKASMSRVYKYDAILLDECFIWQLYKIRKIGFKGPVVGLVVLGSEEMITSPIKEVSDDHGRFDARLAKPVSSRELLKIFKFLGFVTPFFSYAVANQEAALAEEARKREIKRERRQKNARLGSCL